MFNTKQFNLVQTYTPEEVARILKLSKNTVYQLINRGEILAKRIGKVYRIPAISLSFVFSGMDADILRSHQEDEQGLRPLKDILESVRKEVWKTSKSF